MQRNSVNFYCSSAELDQRAGLVTLSLPRLVGRQESDLGFTLSRSSPSQPRSLPLPLLPLVGLYVIYSLLLLLRLSSASPKDFKVSLAARIKSLGFSHRQNNYLLPVSEDLLKI